MVYLIFVMLICKHKRNKSKAVAELCAL